jgi:hypothetical protein
MAKVKTEAGDGDDEGAVGRSTKKESGEGVCGVDRKQGPGR